MIRQGITTLRQAARRLKGRFNRKPLILLYHRIADLQSDPQLLSVTPERFEQHLEILQKQAHPMRLEDMVRAWRENKLPQRAVAVTFDDGYADNLISGGPLLRRHDIPATFFVATGYLGHDREFWWDEVERLFLQPGTLPQELSLTVNGRAHRWYLGDAAEYSEDAYRRNRVWNVVRPENPTPRHEVYRSLCQLLHPLPDQEQRAVFKTLEVWAKTVSPGRPAYRALTPDEVRQATKDGFVEAGSHTVTHPVLSALPVSMQREEIGRSKSRLEEILGYPVRSFAYPYGTRSDYTTQTVSLVREAGYDYACSNFEGLVRPDTDPWQLPRFLVRDWDGDEFDRQLLRWYGA
ncbi:MAG: hypothetical protein NTNFB02_03860 [Nitrospira sp.]